MKIRTLLILPGSFLLCLAACSTEPERPEPPEGYFSTHIEEDGIKKFQYTVDFPDREKSTRGRGRPGNTKGHMSGSSSRGVSGGITTGTGGGGQQRSSGVAGSYERFEQINKRLENMLELELKKSSFCREGYRETERVVEPPMVYIRGECKEMAFDDDREQFPNDGD